ncbi:MAG: hypothetical protein Q9211_005559, partial [Gyalolechia sp. 1 TL-2023]
MRSYSGPPEHSSPSPNGFANQKSKMPLQESTIDHLRQAIKTQAEGIAHPPKILGLNTFWFRKRITASALKHATALIIIHLNDVLDLELNEESTYHRGMGKNPHYQESDWQYAPLSDDEGNARNGVQHIKKEVPKENVETRESEDYGLGNLSNNGLLVDNDHNGENGIGGNVEDHIPFQARKNSGQDSQTELDEIAGPSSGQTLAASPPPFQESPKTKAGLFSNLVPSSLLNLFMPTPPPTPPVKPPKPATPATPPPTAPAVQLIKFYNRHSSRTPEVSPPPTPALPVQPANIRDRRSTQTPERSPPPVPLPA